MLHQKLSAGEQPGTFRVTELVTDDNLLTISQALARQKLAKGLAFTDKHLAWSKQNMSTIGSWGLHTQVQPRFGARAIVERSGISLLWDRSSVYGDADEQWLTDIDTVIPGLIDRLSKLFQQGELLSDQDNLVTLRQGEWVCLANPKASYGYLYLDVYRQESCSVQDTEA